MSIRIRFSPPDRYDPNIPAGELCGECLFVTRRVFPTDCAVCRKYTADGRGEVAWLKMNLTEPDVPLRCLKCREDYPYGGSVIIVAKEREP